VSPQLTSTPQSQKLSAFQITLLVLFLVLCGVSIVSSTAQVSQDNAAASPQREREFKSIVPDHVPIKVKVKNDKSFKDMKNKAWFRELEIEVRNTGSKPIYYLYVVISMPEVIVQGYPLGFRVTYGRSDLLFLSTPIMSDDVPILPGESITLKVPENKVRGYEKTQDTYKKDDPKKIEFELQFMNFGDGTGLQGRDGRTAPDPVRKQSSRLSRPRNVMVLARSLLEFDERTPSDKFLNVTNSIAPAKNLRAHFSARTDALTEITVSPPQDLCGCQGTSDCWFGELGFASCPCDDPAQFPSIVSARSCGSSRGSCWRLETRTESCETQFNGTQYCQFQDGTGSCAVTDPTPTPTPNETPTPTPTATPTPTPTPEPVCATPRPDGSYRRRDDAKRARVFLLGNALTRSLCGAMLRPSHKAGAHLDSREGVTP
jgi:hypothetical protein